MSKFLAVVRIFILAVIYFAWAKVGLSLAFVNESATTVWPPTGISLAAVLVLGFRVWPGIFLGAFLANITTVPSFFTASGIAMGNTLEALAGGYLILRFADGYRAFDKPTHIIRYVFLAALLSPMLSAGVGVGTLFLAGHAAAGEMAPIAFTWWLGDMVSNLVVAPFLIVWATGAPPHFKRSAFAEATLLGLCVFLVSQTVFSGWLIPIKDYPLAYLVIPMLLWAALHFEQRGAASVTLLVSALAIIATLKGRGPFITDNPNKSLVLLQAFMATLSVMGLVLAAVVAQRRKAIEALLQSNSELEQFAYVASHDLQEPLRKIIIFGERLSGSLSDLSVAQKDYLDRMDSAANRMRTLVEDLLQFSRVSREARYEPVALGEVLREVVSDLEIRISQSGASVEIGDLPQIIASRSQMKHVFQNLIANSIKFAKKDAQSRVTVLATPASDGWVEIRVTDNGIGFEQKYVDKIFKPFQRLHSRGEYEGTGIGLAIVQKIVQNHGGRLTAKSQVNQGAVFIIQLPKNRQ